MVQYGGLWRRNGGKFSTLQSHSSADMKECCTGLEASKRMAQWYRAHWSRISTMYSVAVELVVGSVVGSVCVCAWLAVVVSYDEWLTAPTLSTPLLPSSCPCHVGCLPAQLCHAAACRTDIKWTDDAAQKGLIINAVLAAGCRPPLYGRCPSLLPSTPRESACL